MVGGFALSRNKLRLAGATVVLAGVGVASSGVAFAETPAHLELEALGTPIVVDGVAQPVDSELWTLTSPDGSEFSFVFSMTTNEVDATVHVEATAELGDALADDELLGMLGLVLDEFADGTHTADEIAATQLAIWSLTDAGVPMDEYAQTPSEVLDLFGEMYGEAQALLDDVDLESASDIGVHLITQADGTQLIGVDVDGVDIPFDVDSEVEPAVDETVGDADAEGPEVDGAGAAEGAAAETPTTDSTQNPAEAEPVEAAEPIAVVDPVEPVEPVEPVQQTVPDATDLSPSVTSVPAAVNGEGDDVVEVDDVGTAGEAANPVEVDAVEPSDVVEADDPGVAIDVVGAEAASEVDGQSGGAEPQTAPGPVLEDGVVTAAEPLVSAAAVPELAQPAEPRTEAAAAARATANRPASVGRQVPPAAPAAASNASRGSLSGIASSQRGASAPGNVNAPPTKSPNAEPRLNLKCPSEIATDAPTTFSADANDPDGDPVIFQWLLNGKVVPGQFKATFSTPVKAGDVIEVLGMDTAGNVTRAPTSTDCDGVVYRVRAATAQTAATPSPAAEGAVADLALAAQAPQPASVVPASYKAAGLPKTGVPIAQTIGLGSVLVLVGAGTLLLAHKKE